MFDLTTTDDQKSEIALRLLNRKSPTEIAQDLDIPIMAVVDTCRDEDFALTVEVQRDLWISNLEDLRMEVINKIREKLGSAKPSELNLILKNVSDLAMTARGDKEPPKGDVHYHLHLKKQGEELLKKTS